MTDTTMPPEVAEATDALNLWLGSDEPRWSLIRDHLRRLAEENARLREESRLAHSRWSEFAQLSGAEQRKRISAEAERDALKARIAEANRVSTGLYPAHGSGYVSVITEPSTKQGAEVFAMIKLEDGE